jgi:hypothetical protein
LRYQGVRIRLLAQIIDNLIVVRGFSLVHDPEGSHYENREGEWVLKLDKINLVLNLRQN